MSDYKKKSVKRKPVKQDRRDLKMSNSRSQIQEKPKFRVHNGKKNSRKLSFLIAAATVILIGAVYFIILAFHPIGVGEFFSTRFKVGGKGAGYDVELKGNNVYTVDCQDNYYYTLTETTVYCNNENGKSISEIEHGFALPVLHSSETRYIIYGQGEQTAKVYNLDKELHNLHYDGNILAAAINDNGNFAVATTEEGYDSKITVYNKNCKILYEWYSSNGIVSSVEFIQNGKKLLVSTFSAVDGEFVSKILLLNFKSADAEQTFSFDNELCYQTHFLTKDIVSVVFENSVRFINLKDGSTITNSFDYSIKLAKPFDNHLLISGNLDSNTDNNHITLYNKKSECITNLIVDFSVKEAVYKSKHIYLLSDNFINCYNLKGELVYTSEVTFDVQHIIPLGDKSVITVTNNFISKANLEKAE